MKKISQVSPKKFSMYKGLHIKTEGGDDIYLNKKEISLPGLDELIDVNHVEIVFCKVNEKLKFSYFISEYKKATVETEDLVSEIMSEKI